MTLLGAKMLTVHLAVRFFCNVILIADTVSELQKQINVLQEFALKLGIIVKMKKI